MDRKETAPVVQSVRQVERFAPDGESGPVFLLRPPRYFERALFSRAMAERGAFFPGDLKLIEAMRDAIAALEPDNVVELTALLDQAETATRSGQPMAPDQAKDVATLELKLRGLPDVAALLAAREHWLNTIPGVAFSMFCDGWEGVAAKYKRVGSFIPDATLDRLDHRHVTAAGWKAWDLMQPSRDAEKNSDSPSPSSPMANGSTAPSTQPRSDPSPTTPSTSA